MNDKLSRTQAEIEISTQLGIMMAPAKKRISAKAM
eukprot:CAMPEP_0170471700 /NCGR_PEP_ID=MMETSP0123-20130129/13872_1 /TAXON_ID=182087 /ORGANISM="Favella ehrenbergii, Strain Fehren 1" /LENGTH=34 /DNA_ID= /DNA_START= /DNA_END= /DNA_ORIENTATION=